ncbi:MAG: hypothetical protein IKU88_00020 [Alistipes sp.]|nr:hypothetical protein [Alistipes sp.]
MKQILCLFIGLVVFAMSVCGRIENDRLREVKKLMGRKIVFGSSLEPIDNPTLWKLYVDTANKLIAE